MDNTIGEQIEALRLDCERREVYYKTIITTNEVTICQQAIQIKKLEKGVGELKQDSLNRQTAIDIERKKLINKHEQLTKAGEVVSDNVDTIVRLQAESQEGWDLAESYNIKIEELEETIDIEAWEIVDEQVIEIQNLQMDVKQLQDQVDSMEKTHTYLMDERSSLFNAAMDFQEEHTLTDDSLILQYTGVIEVEDNPFPGTTTPVPHPYTHPIRDVPESGKVKVNIPV
jgi:chromosome segregation ATPase